MGVEPGASAVPPEAHRHLAIADRLLPGRVVGYYVVGSGASGAYVAGRSDVDVVVVVDRRLTPAELRRLRAVHVATGVATVGDRLFGRATRLDGVVGEWLAAAGMTNASILRADQLRRPVTEIEPEASHVGELFKVGAAFDVNPVQWQTFERHGLALRGPAPSSLGLDAEPAVLRDWNLANLDAYWGPWGEAQQRSFTVAARLRTRWNTAWGMLGAPRLHHTIATGEVISKEAAGRWALDVFDARWHPLLLEALAYREGAPEVAGLGDPRSRARETGMFVTEVVAAAKALPPPQAQPVE